MFLLGMFELFWWHSSQASGRDKGHAVCGEKFCLHVVSPLLHTLYQALCLVSLVTCISLAGPVGSGTTLALPLAGLWAQQSPQARSTRLT